MNSEPITRQRIDELVAFLPLFNAPERQFVEQWVVAGRTENGVRAFPYPVYTDDVQEFFRLAGQLCWSDENYEPRAASRMLEDNGFIEKATLDHIKTMLTYCVRGERFGDGHWEAMLKSGKIAAILQRLAVLRASV